METVTLYKIILERQNRRNSQKTNVDEECDPLVYLDQADAEAAAKLNLSFVSLKELCLQVRVQMDKLELTDKQVEILNRQRFISLNVLSQPRS